MVKCVWDTYTSDNQSNKVAFICVWYGRNVSFKNQKGELFPAPVDVMERYLSENLVGDWAIHINSTHFTTIISILLFDEADITHLQTLFASNVRLRRHTALAHKTYQVQYKESVYNKMRDMLEQNALLHIASRNALSSK